MRRRNTRWAREGRQRAGLLFRRFGAELRLARIESGLTQRRLAELVGVSQPFVSFVETSLRRPDWPTACALAAAVGLDLSLRTFAGRTIGLRDSGQFLAVQHIATHAHGSWHPRLEVAVSKLATDRRAADLVLIGSEEVLHVEVERAIVDFQAQLRSGQLKRTALTELFERPVRLVIAVPGTRRTREKIARLRPALSIALPAASNAVWRSIRAGAPLGSDGLLYLPGHL
jgi:transcriptional regulator with XRE-family HTH domain